LQVEAGRLILERLGLAKLKDKRMKREGYIIEEIIDERNLEDAFYSVLRGNERKQLAEGRWLIEHKKEFLDEVKAEIISGYINIGKWHPKDIIEAGKHRHLQVFDMKTRIKIAAVMQVVDKHLKKRYIRTTSSAIKNRGMHDLKAYIERDLREYKIKYWFKFDFSKFYETIIQDFVMYAYRRVFKDERLLNILNQFVRVLPGGVGISMGLRSSQSNGNILLSVYLDHYLKDRYRVMFFYRYCDDGLNGSRNDKDELWECRDFVHSVANKLGQTIKPNERVFPSSLGLDFLGYVIYPTHTLLRKRVKQNFARKLHKLKSRKRRIEIVGSLWGMAKHCDSWHLLEKLLFKKEYLKLKKKAMKDFGKPKSSPQTIDGKKSFRGQKISGRELDHQPFIVIDYETGVIPSIEQERYKREIDDTMARGGDTNLVKKPRQKYVVSIIYNGALRKLWTGDKENMDELDRRREEPDGLPFFASMVTDYSGQYPKYSFCSATALGFTMPTDEELNKLFTVLKINLK